MGPIDSNKMLKLEAELDAAQACCRLPSFREQVALQLANAIKEVERLKELSELLDRNPEVQRILDLMKNRL